MRTERSFGLSPVAISIPINVPIYHPSGVSAQTMMSYSMMLQPQMSKAMAKAMVREMAIVSTELSCPRYL
jgi:hypothetical protein